jgi:hypothetical protein
MLTNQEGLHGRNNPVRQGYIKDGIGYIPLTKGLWALCDAHWFHYLSQFNWYAQRSSHGRWYAKRAIRLNGKRATQAMARVIMGVTDPKIQVDHVRRDDTLDNREENLRIATNAQNGCNRGLQTNNSSGFRGVFQVKEKNKWRAKVKVNQQTIHLGCFDTPVHAAAIYNWVARRLHGAFAYQNDLSQVSDEDLKAA